MTKLISYNKQTKESKLTSMRMVKFNDEFYDEIAKFMKGFSVTKIETRCGMIIPISQLQYRS